MSAPHPDSKDALQQLALAKEFAKQCGGVDKAIAMLDAYESAIAAVSETGEKDDGPAGNVSRDS